MAYYLTVCCETYCYYKPEKVFDFFENAIVENEKYNNHNNLGKIYYSIAIGTLQFFHGFLSLHKMEAEDIHR